MQLYELVGTLMHEQEVIVIDYYNGKTYARGKARGVAYSLEYNEYLRDSKIQLVEIDINNSSICIHVLKD